MKTFKSILLVDLFNLFTNAIWVLFAIGFPVVLTLVLGFLTKGFYDTEFTSYDYYGISTMFFAITNAATFSANSFMEEKLEKANMRIIYSPINPSFIYLSKMIATTLFCSLTGVISALLLHFIVNTNYGKSFLWASFLIMFFANLLFSTLGILVCCIFKNESITNQIISPIIAILCLLGGSLFPMGGFGKIITVISKLSPITWLFRCVIEITYDHNLTLLLPIITASVVVTCILIFCSHKLFKQEDYI